MKQGHWLTDSVQLFTVNWIKLKSGFDPAETEDPSVHSGPDRKTSTTATTTGPDLSPALQRMNPLEEKKKKPAASKHASKHTSKQCIFQNKKINIVFANVL